MNNPIANTKVHPSSIRVWLGFRSEAYRERREAFYKMLSETFIPVTVQQMSPLGLTSYFPIIMPASSNHFPDELALVAYPSPSLYRSATRETVVGRAYGALHSVAFNFNQESDIPHSTSAFPVPFDALWAFDKPYYLLNDSISWREGQTLVHVAKFSQEQGAPCRHDIAERVERWRASRPKGVDGSIFRVQDNYLIYWEHYQSLEGRRDSLLDHLEDLLDPAFVSETSVITQVLPMYSTPDPGVDTQVGVLMDVREGSG